MCAQYGAHPVPSTGVVCLQRCLIYKVQIFHCPSRLRTSVGDATVNEYITLSSLCQVLFLIFLRFFPWIGSLFDPLSWGALIVYQILLRLSTLFSLFFRLFSLSTFSTNIWPLFAPVLGFFVYIICTTAYICPYTADSDGAHLKKGAAQKSIHTVFTAAGT